MNKEDVMRIGLLLNKINNKIGWQMAYRVRDEISEIEDIVAKYAPADAVKTKKQKLEEQLKELEEREFNLKMKDRWDSADGLMITQIHDDMQKIKEQLADAE